MSGLYYAVCAAAFICAALTPAVITASLAGSVTTIPLVFAIALGHAVFIGLPLFYALNAKGRVNGWTSVACGFIAGMLPIAFFAFPFGGSGSSASINNVPTIIDGVPTLAGWRHYIKTLLYAGGFGAGSGLVFWMVLWVSGYSHVGNRAAVSTVSLYPGSRPYIGTSLVGVAALSVVVVFAIPTLTKDRSCHNMFRDGRTSIGPRLRIDLDIGLKDWPLLVDTFDDFGAAHDFSFRDSSRETPDVVRVLGLSLCNENGVVITVTEQRWAHQNYAPTIENRGTGLGIYETLDGSPWQEIGSKFVDALEARWPGKLKFIGPGGREIPRPEFLTSTNQQ